jgi:hypothetical protein
MEMQKRTDGQTQENRHRENKQRGKQIEGKVKRDKRTDTGKINR